MLTKFESKSNRVKGLCFHPSRPWVLTSLHNGVIQLWDFRMGTLIDRFDEHDGPVRSVDFHKSQPLFVSGGDDYKIKVWDYKLRRCLFTLLGHLDYIRTVQFHHEYPWIVSCSDDQTIRIWNWQSRSCVSVLTGHNHYVMSCSFHPKEDLIVSASLDQTVRVWDTTGLRKKTVRGAPSSMEDMMPPGVSGRSGADLFGASDAVVKYVLEGHDRGVNWASFHPTLPLIVSGSDDRQVKLWRMNDTKAWEVDTMRGHTNNVSCVIFHPRQELIISNSEDRSIRVWDIAKRMGLQTFRRENDRFWMLQAHPNQNLLAAGHDSGMIVFKLERERPAMDFVDGSVLYVKERYVRRYRFSDGSDNPVATLRRSGSGLQMGQQPRYMHYNPFDPPNASSNSILLCSDVEGGSYDLVTFTPSNNDVSDSSRGTALFAVFVARQRFAVLDKSRHLVIKNMQNEIVKKITPPNGTTDGLFPGGTVGRVLLRIDDKMVMYDTDSRRVLADLVAPRVKYVVWSPNGEYVAMMSKHSVYIADKSFKHLCTVTELVKVKSGIWGNDIFVYTTQNHIKYALPNGDSGIIRTLDVPVYLTHLEDSKLYCLDRECKMRILSIDLTECEFKLALAAKQFTTVMRMVKHSRLCGQAIISYLTQKGYPEVALHFVNDEKTRFKLAISCGNLEVALNSAYELDDTNCWHQLGVEALRQGNISVVEMAYQRTKNFERLSFLYLITGNRDKLKKMLKIAGLRNDIMSRFHNALYLGDVPERIDALEAAGQHALALLTAATHGLDEHVARIVAHFEETDPSFDYKAFLARETSPNAALFLPPFAVTQLENENWPIVELNEPTMADHAEAAEKQVSKMPLYEQEEAPRRSIEARKQSDDFMADADTGAWGDEDEGLFSDNDGSDRHSFDEFHDPFTSTPASSDYHAAPTAGTPIPTTWTRNSSIAAEHVAAGSFDTAMQLLHRQIGVVNFASLKPLFLSIYAGSSAIVPTQGNVPSLRTWIQRGNNEPMVATSIHQLVSLLKEAYRGFSGAKFDDVEASCRSILQGIPLLAVDTKEQAAQVKELAIICREYLLACRIRAQLSTVSLDADPKRNIELSAYWTHCRLQPSHMMLTLKSAMTNAYKCNNYITAASFCRRLLEIPEVNTEKNAKLAQTAKKVLQKAEKEARNEHQVDYNDSRGFTLCARTLVPLYSGEGAKCPYCASTYTPQCSGSICDVCDLSKIGEETLGLVVSK
ncbi:coatomer protein complex [Thraustotheca clavata]|uniref:Coatomer subunit alpha n=1 Tax=Thraustotheca clavata TaxID=74557 RepID=A0A1V9Z4L0_9STRA|nr:coatomer protein complex [Thraustotheca clavata]